MEEGGEGDGDKEHQEREGEVPVGGGEGEHAYLLLSRADSTMVLQTGQEIAELDSSGFATLAPTVYAGNLGRGSYIVQVSQHAVDVHYHTVLVDWWKSCTSCMGPKHTFH